ncbi:MAG TPA: FKBP-type peptidyl-prolyl cis-trans isomerase [Steroidobacteraceae bacterium]|nr:FKBP-type peptidyl-prolyl cis-trans isomerase [Steroidobacteraceae bacterium]
MPSRIASASLAALLLAWLPAGCSREAAAPAAAPAAAAPAELGVTELAPGHGDPVAAGASVRVHYTGWLYDPAAAGGKGAQFDSSVGGEPFVFPLGAGRVIRGWDLGVAGMRAGGKRRLLIPPGLGYGERGAGGVIPPNATLLFEVELLDFQPAP